MAELAFDLEYEGPALEAHEMDVRDLAPALLSTAELLQELNRTMHPADPPVAVTVRATAEGSFIVQLKLIHEQYDQIFTSADAVATATLLALLGGLGSLIRFFVQRARAAVTSQETLPLTNPADPEVVRITFADGTVLEIPASLLRAAELPAVRRPLGEVVKPLARDGIDAVRVRRDNETIGRVEKADLPAFDTSNLGPPPRQVLLSSERDVYLSIVNAAFQPGLKWRVHDGQSTFYATLSDEGFVERIQQGEPFSALDVLRCRIRETQWRDASGLHAEVEIIDVMSHEQPAPPQQRSMDLEDRFFPGVVGDDDPDEPDGPLALGPGGGR